MLRRINQQFVRRVGFNTALLLVTLSLCFSRPSFAQELELFPQFFQASNLSKAAGQAFRAARDLISERKWADATAKFNEFIRAYPRDKNLDAALYWLAFCLKQQGKPLDAEQALERLLKEYPRSNWKDDARALRLELAEALNNLVAAKEALGNSPAQPVLPARSASVASPGALGNVEAANREVEREQIIRERDQIIREREQIIREGSQSTLDNNDPNAIKMVALQSLFQADPERALNIATGFLSADAKASPAIQEAALGLIARHGEERARPALVAAARNPTLAESVREQALYWIAHERRAETLNTLMQLYDAEKNETLKERLLYWLAHSDSDQGRTKINEIARSDANLTLRERAMYWIAHRSGEQSFNTLNELYGVENDATIKDRILYWFAHSSDSRAQARIVEIARNDANLELRDKAIYWIAHREGAEATNTLSRLYDEQKVEEIKERILYWLSQRGEKAGLQKLVAVAKSDSSQHLREKAVYYLGQSKDPEALKLLEQILK